jgi:capsule polysaccharide modification protein KpsS
MTGKELKNWVNELPEEVLEYPVYGGEEMKVGDTYMYRLQYAITTCVADNKEKFIGLLREYTEEKS